MQAIRMIMAMKSIALMQPLLIGSAQHGHLCLNGDPGRAAVGGPPKRNEPNERRRRRVSSTSLPLGKPPSLRAGQARATIRAVAGCGSLHLVQSEQAAADEIVSVGRGGGEGDISKHMQISTTILMLSTDN